MNLVLNKNQLEALKEYKHSCVDMSFISTRIMKHWWAFAARFVPSFISPNMVTIFGMSATVIALWIVTLFSPRFFGYIPPWVAFFGSACFFLFQTCDAVDGIHARKTRMFSPLGDLIDHACDTIVYLTGSWCMSAFFQLGASGWAYTLIATCIGSSFVCQWDCFYSETIFLGPINGPTEGVLVSIALVLVTGFTGTEMWNHSCGPITAGQLVAAIITFLLIIMFIGSPIHVISLCREKSRSVGAAFAKLIPPVAAIVMGYVWITCFPDALDRAPRAFMLIFSAGLTHLTNEMIIARLSKRMPSWGLPVLAPIAAPLALRALALLPSLSPLCVCLVATWEACFAVVSFVSVFRQASDYLGIPMVAPFEPRP